MFQEEAGGGDVQVDQLGCNKQFEFNCKSRDMLCDELQWALEDTLGAGILPP